MKKTNLLFILLMLFLLAGCRITGRPAISYTEFKKLSNEEQMARFSEMSGEEIYRLVSESETENWPVTAYDLVSPENAKEIIILNEFKGELSFNLNWPPYGGYEISTIRSISDLEGTVEVSRDGGDSGHTMSWGKNEDGTYPNNSQRAIPKSSSEIRTGRLDVDRYKEVVAVILKEEDDGSKIEELEELGFDEESAVSLLSDYDAWHYRTEIADDKNIAEGAALAGNEVVPEFGYYGKTARWEAGSLIMEGGAGQMNTVFSWGTLNQSGLITDAGTATIH